MSGHSKWATTKHKKAIIDAKKGKVLTKHSKILMVVGRDDPNPETNSSLRVAIANAKADNVPHDNIDRILKKLAGEGKNASQYVEQIYEGFGPGGNPVIVRALTDNPNRTLPLVRTVFTKHGGTLGNPGCVRFLFDHVGVLFIKNSGKSEDEILEKVLDLGALDFHYDEEESEVITSFSDLGRIRNILLEKKIDVVKSEAQYRLKDPKEISDEVREKMHLFIEALEDIDDVDDAFFL